MRDYKVNMRHSKIVYPILLKASYDIFFAVVVSRIYLYECYIISVNIYKLILSWIAAVVLFILVPVDNKKISSLFYHTQYIITVLPLLTIFSLTDRSTIYTLLVCLTVGVEAFIITHQGKKHIAFNIRIETPWAMLSIAILSFILLVVYLNARYLGINGLEAFDTEQVYVIRSSNQGKIPSWLSYFTLWCYCFAAPLGMAIFLYSKRYIYAGIVIIANILLYLSTANKFIYLSLAVIIATFIGVRLRKLIHLEYIGLTVTCLLSAICYYLQPMINIKILEIFSSYTASFLGDRFLFGPQMNKFAYYEVFKGNMVLFSDGRIGQLLGISYPYGDKSLGQLAYQYLFPEKIELGNYVTGYLGDGYAQLGFIGMIIMAIVLVYVVKIIDNGSRRIPLEILAVMINIYVVSLNDTALQTVLLSGGLIFLIVFCLIISLKKDNRMGDIK